MPKVNPTTFPNGISTAQPTDPLLYGSGSLHGFPAPDPTKLSTFWTDFHTFTAGDWTITETEAGAGDASQVITDEANGVLLITNDAADNDLVSMQLVGESFLPAAGRDIWFKTKLKISDATDSDFLVGLVVTDTSPLTNANGIYFIKPDDAAVVNFVTNASSTATTSSSVHTAVADTYVTLGFRVSGTGIVDYYVNDVYGGRHTTNIPTTELKVTIHIQNGAAAAKTMSLDYILASQTR